MQHTQGRWPHVEAELAVRPLQAQEHQGSLVMRQGHIPFRELQREDGLRDTWAVDCDVSDFDKINFCGFKQRNLWHIVASSLEINAISHNAIMKITSIVLGR